MPVSPEARRFKRSPLWSPGWNRLPRDGPNAQALRQRTDMRRGIHRATSCRGGSAAPTRCNARAARSERHPLHETRWLDCPSIRTISVHLPKGLDQRRLAVEIDRVSILRSFHPVDANRTSTLRLRREVAWFAPSKGLLDFPNSFRGRSRIENQLSERKELLSQVRRVRLEYGCHVIRNSFFPAGDAHD